MAPSSPSSSPFIGIIEIFPEIFPSLSRLSNLPLLPRFPPGSPPDTSAWRRVHTSFCAMCAVGVDSTRYVMVVRMFSSFGSSSPIHVNGEDSHLPQKGECSGLEGEFSPKRGNFRLHLPLFQGEERENNRIPCDNIVKKPRNRWYKKLYKYKKLYRPRKVNYPPTCVSDKKSSMIGKSGLAEWIVFYGEEDG